MLLFEGETDTMAAWQGAPPEARKGIVGLSGLNAWKDRYAEELFGQAKRVWVCFDNDDPYGPASAQNDKSWAQIKQALGRKAKRVKMPQGIEDVAEFFMQYDWAAFRVLLKQANEVTWHYPALDLSGPVPEYDWLVDNLIVRGDIVLVSGDPGVGKSWLTLDLATAITQGRDQWLGIDLKRHGRVLYIDQEGPQVTARKRLAALGLNDTGIANMRYLWYAGVRLDERPERLFEDAENWEPELMVIDSISRVHFKNENAAEEMNPLLNGGIYPIARALGITVVLIHHLSKEGRTRGSTALPAAVDLSLGIKNQVTKQGAETGRQLIVPDKLRNVPPWGSALLIERVEENGLITIQQAEETDAF